MDQDQYSFYSNEELVEQLNHEFREAVLPVTIFVGLEVVVGFFGNLLVIYVFLFRYHVCNFKYFVLCMAFVDITSTLTTMPGEMLTQLYWYAYPVREVCKVKSFFNVFTVSAEALCLLTIAIDRYRKVCRPFGWQIRPKIAIFLCGVIYTAAFILAFPVGFLWGISHPTKLYNNITFTVTICETDEAYDGTDYPLHYSASISVIISLCLLLMCGLYVCIARKLIKRKGTSSGVMVVISPPSSTHAGASSEVIETSQKPEVNPEVSDTGYSSGIENKSKISNYRYVSSDGGLTTDEEDECSQITSISRFPGEKHAPFQGKGKSITTKSQRTKRRGDLGSRVRRKTMIMCILTISFTITTLLYLTLLSCIAWSDNILQSMSDTGKAVYFFFFRLYFTNHVINPFLYGFLDPHFKKVLKKWKHSICRCI